MEPKPIVMYFSENHRNPERSAVVGHLVQAPPARAIVIFPNPDYEREMRQAGWYYVRITFNESGRVGFATPILDRSVLEVIRDLADAALQG